VSARFRGSKASKTGRATWAKEFFDVTFGIAFVTEKRLISLPEFETEFGHIRELRRMSKLVAKFYGGMRDYALKDDAYDLDIEGGLYLSFYDEFAALSALYASDGGEPEEQLPALRALVAKGQKVWVVKPPGNGTLHFFTGSRAQVEDKINRFLARWSRRVIRAERLGDAGPTKWWP
jgi:hypothetical protein